VSDANHYKAFRRNALQNLFKNPQPISAQNFFDVSVGEAAFDQFAGEIARMRVVR
jgi:hypothetical protein